VPHTITIETISQFELTVGLDEIYVRVWRGQDSYTTPIRHRTESTLFEAGVRFTRTKEPWTIFDLAKHLLEIDRVNAVEVKNAQGNGVVLYKDWP
jgi:hypothetical protein